MKKILLVAAFSVVLFANAASGQLAGSIGAGGTPSGTAGGDLSGSYPNPTVAKVGGVAPGTGVTTALGVNVGTAGSVVVNGGALGTPSSGTLTNATGLPAAGVTGLAASATTDTTNATNITSGTLAAARTTRPKIISGTWDISATTNFSVTGCGFSPRAGIFIGTVATVNNNVSWGMTDGTVSEAMNGRGTTATVPNFGVPGGTTTIMSAIVDTSNQNQATLVSMDSDGFTFARNKTGSPTGTFTYFAMCIP